MSAALILGAVAVFLMMGGLGEGQEALERIDYPEHGTATVVAYIGDDPERQTVTWSLSGADAGDFEIDGGGLTFITPPDYEHPADSDTDNTYEVTVEASDGTTATVTQMVEVRVTNEDDAGEIKDLTVQPQVGVAASVKLEDADGPSSASSPQFPITKIDLTDGDGNSDLKWQWARGTSKTGPWTDIQDDQETSDVKEGEENFYTPTKDDLDRYLRVTVTYRDGHCPCSSRKTAQDTSDNKVIDKPFTDQPPVFDQDPDKVGVQVSFDEDPAKEGVQITIAENSPAGTAIGAPIAAKALDIDGNQRTLNYTLGGGSFDIDQGTGQIRVSSSLDHENKDTYDVTVTARDPSRSSNDIAVTIVVTDVDEDPMITDGGTSINYAEIIEGKTAQPVGASSNVYSAEDPDANDTLRWSLSGSDASKFTINNLNQLEFREPADFEARADSGRDNVYNVTVVVTDSAGNTATRDVIINVTDVEEKGLVRLSNRQPQVGTKITATLSDGDIVSRGSVTWEWSGDGKVTSSGASSTYTPVVAGSYLTATATYTDGRGSGETAFNQPRDYLPVQPAKDSRNERPVFAGSSATRSVGENNKPNTALTGGAFDVTDGDDAATSLTYSLSRGDLNLFFIDWASGVISTNGQLDYEVRSSHSVTVRVTDASLGTDTISVTINVIDEDEKPIITDGETAIEYAEITGGARSGPVATYKASNPDKKKILWSLAGTHSDDFSISSGGVLTFNEPPDYETQQEYSITVQASDGGAEVGDRDITVTVTNVDEPGKVTLSDLEPQESTDQTQTPVTATLTDPDKEDADNITWQWARSAGRSGPWTDIRGTDEENSPLGKSAVYLPAKDDVGKYLRVTASYTDGHGGGKEAHLVSDKAVRRTPYVNKAPKFQAADGTEREAAARSIAENSKQNTPVGDPVAATDIGPNGRQELLTYTLSGDDAAKFDIDRRTGQIKTKAMLNFESGAAVDNCETKNSCRVIVTAADSSDNPNADPEVPSRDTINVTITVTDVNEAPVFGDSDAVTEGVQAPPKALRVAENQTVIDADLIAEKVQAPTYTATDPEGAAVGLTLAGTDAGHFKIDADGVLSFKEGQDYEDPADSGGNRVYNVTVQATDVGRNTSSVDVVVTVTNANEDGIITLSHLQPQVGESLTARLTDPDGGIRSISWQWYRGNAGTDNDEAEDDNIKKCSAPSASAPCSIDSATSATYSPVTADHDANVILTVIAKYTDLFGNGQVAVGKSVYKGEGEGYTVQGTKNANKAPRFLDSNDKDIRTAEREILENAKTDASVGTPVEAIDEDDKNLDYSLGGTDAGHFAINRATGQIKTKTTLDYESTKKTYTVDVRARDPEGLTDSIRVTIRVTNVDEQPDLLKKALVVRGDRSIGYAENSADAVGNYTAAGPNAANVSWTLTGSDARDFSISRTGQLTFRSTPNFESPADSNRDNTYVVTVNASTRSVRDTLRVTVDVANVDEEGEARLSPNRGNVGSKITATVTDLDGTPTNVLWEWERSEDGDSGWTSISGANSGTYTPNADDVDNYLRATARYADPQGPGKRAEAITTAQVRSDDDGVVTLSPARLSVGDTVTPRLTDPDGNIRNTNWQWASSSDGQTGWSDITGATSATYTIVAADIGDFLRATASYDDGDGTGKSADGVSSAAVVEDDDGSVTLSPSRPQVGNRVTATITDPDGGVTGVTWVWEISSNGMTNWSAIIGGTSNTYRITAANLAGSYLRATASYTDQAGPNKSAQSASSGVIREDDDGVVTLSLSSPEVGDTVTATLSDPDAGVTGVTWQWAFSANGSSNWTIMLGATTARYTATEANVGNYLRARATYTDSVGSGKDAEAVTSGAVREDDDGVVTLSTSAPEVLTPITATLSDPDRPFINVMWQWAKSSNRSTWTDISGGASATYTPAVNDEGSYLRATASYDDTVGKGKSAEAATGSKVAPLDLFGKYDSDRSGSIDRSETTQAVRDYFSDEISKDEVITILLLYFAG